MTNPLYWSHEPSRHKAHVLRRAAAAALHAASTALANLARRLTVVEYAPHRAQAACLPEVEFHAFHSDAGAPEGALYVDGELVGYLPVSRL